ncbi:urease accessory protein UreF [Alicyclobacillus suci]|uniref:urease accessory protein UreF n=1 Tax=Alicyclobacillus suci TaxID=2816080 RepID=UPI001A8C8249|nr:urease accessory UreF family protein [Alicyclobacillus suci]
MNAQQLSFMLQICDGNFPNGAFSHSFGLETLIETGVVHDAATFQSALKSWFDLQLIPFDGLAAHLAWEYAHARDGAGVIRLADVVSSSLIAEQAKRGSLQIGKRSLQVLYGLVPGGITEWYWQRVCAGEVETTHGIALAVAAAEIGIEQSLSTAAVLYSALSSLVAAGVRAIPIGQTVGQQILATARRWMQEAPDFTGRTPEDISSSAVRWEIAQMNHKRLNGRLFMS